MKESQNRKAELVIECNKEGKILYWKNHTTNN